MSQLNYISMLEKINALQAEAKRVRKEELAEVVREIKSQIVAYGLSAEDLGLGKTSSSGKPKRATKAPRKSAKQPRSKRGSVPVKYSDGLGNTWTGRGLQPKWVKDALSKGATLEALLIKAG